MRNAYRVPGADAMRRRFLKTAAAALAAPAATAWPASTQSPRRGGTLRVANGGDPPDFDVHQSVIFLTHFVAQPCYSNLLRIDPSDYSRLLPDLAARTEVSDAGRTVTFHLRKGVLFHNGLTLSADDVVYSLERIRNPPKGIVSPRRTLLANCEAIEARDELTVVVRLAQPQPDFLFLVSNPFNVIVPRKVAQPLDADGQGMKRQLIGTGPFRLTRAVDGQIYELSRFEGYFGPAPYLDKIQFFPIKGEIERSAALRSRRIDACFVFDNESVLATLRSVPGMVVQQQPVPGFINIIPNVQRKPFDDIRVREALSLAVDREALVKTVGPISGARFHSTGLLPPGSPYSLSAEELRKFSGYDTQPGLGGNIAANRERAMALLEQAGVARGFKVVILTRGDLPQFRDCAIAVAAHFKTIGLDATVDVRDAGAFFAAENKGDFQVVVHSISVGGSTPDQILGEAYTSYSGRNYGRWKDDSLDDLYRQQSRELDAEKRAQLIRQFQIAFLRTYYHINLAWRGYHAAHWDYVKGWAGLPDRYANMQMDRTWMST